MTDDDFWAVARAAPAGAEYFDGGTKRVFELAAEVAPNSVAWMKVEWPYLELYVYETDNGARRLKSIRDTFQVESAERPKDHGHEMDQDWVVRLAIP
jgi:hypothetical protein